MSDGRLVPSSGLHVVRAEGAWLLAPAATRDPVPVDLETVLRLVRASGGASVTFEPEVEACLREALAVTEVPVARNGVARRRRPEAAVPLDDRASLRPVPAFLGAPLSGFLRVDGLGGRSLLLDHVDLALIDTLAFGGPAADVLATTATRLKDLGLGDEPPDVTELRCRAADLVAVGRLFADLPGAPSPAPEAPVAVEAPAPPEPVHPERYTPEGSDPLVHYFADPRPEGPAGRIPVYSVFQPDVGPAASLGMLLATARHHRDGALNETFELRRVEDPGSMLTDLAGREGPAVLLCSNYLWSVEKNLDVARRAKAINPDLLIIHGGPSTPKYDGDCHQFFADNADIVDVTVRGEGEDTLVAILDVLAATAPDCDLDRLADVAGLSFTDSSGRVVTTPERDRIADLDRLPSPYLTGEFDHVHPSAWKDCLNIESNRGCPYGCTFCDWGSMTLSRIRKFDIDRVAEEMAWAGRRGHTTWVIADANFGIFERDVEITERLSEAKRTYGYPMSLGFTVAKNTTRHLTRIFDELVRAGVEPHCSLSLQSHDEETLEALRRKNISTEHYLSIATSFRTRGLPLLADLMVALPGQTMESFLADVQFLFDHLLPTRIWPTQLLPNAPMNDPEYKAEYQLAINEENLVISSSTFTEAEREEMMQLRQANAVLEQFGLARHLMRFLQWDHGIAATTFLRRTLAVTNEHPDRYPLVNFVLKYFEVFSVPPLGWRAFYSELRRLVVNELGVPLSAALESVLELQEFLMPENGRSFPDSIVLEHDYLSYFEDATASLWTTGEAKPVERTLDSYGPARFHAFGDPHEFCSGGMLLYRGSRDQRMVKEFWITGHFEIDTRLVWNYPAVAATNAYRGLLERTPTDVVDLGRSAADTMADLEARRGADGGPVPVSLRDRAVPVDR